MTPDAQKMWSARMAETETETEAEEPKKPGRPKGAPNRIKKPNASDHGMVVFAVAYALTLDEDKASAAVDAYRNIGLK